MDTFKTMQLVMGHPKSRDQGVSAMDAVAWLAGEPHTDRPQTTCPFLTTVINELNDTLSDDERQTILKPLVPKLVKTRHNSLEYARQHIAHSWTLRVGAPAWLDLAGQDRDADILRSLPSITDHLPPDQLYQILPILLLAHNNVRPPRAQDETLRLNTEAMLEASGIYLMYLPPDQLAGLPLNIAKQAAYKSAVLGRDLEPTAAGLRTSMLETIDLMIDLKPDTIRTKAEPIGIT